MSNFIPGTTSISNNVGINTQDINGTLNFSSTGISINKHNNENYLYKDKLVHKV